MHMDWNDYCQSAFKIAPPIVKWTPLFKQVSSVAKV